MGQRRRGDGHVSVDRFDLVVPGEPVPNARARQGRGGGFYTPAATAEYRERVRQAWMIAGRPCVGSEPLAVSATFHRSSRRVADLDNLLKGVLDALNGLAWGDDAPVVCFAGVHRTQADELGPRTVLAAWHVHVAQVGRAA
jgi:Holliday junction resolvase RusA-like endonuclease